MKRIQCSECEMYVWIEDGEEVESCPLCGDEKGFWY